MSRPALPPPVLHQTSLMHRSPQGYNVAGVRCSAVVSGGKIDGKGCTGAYLSPAEEEVRVLCTTACELPRSGYSASWLEGAFSQVRMQDLGETKSKQPNYRSVSVTQAHGLDATSWGVHKDAAARRWLLWASTLWPRPPTKLSSTPHVECRPRSAGRGTSAREYL